MSRIAFIALTITGLVWAATDKELAFIGARAKYWAFQKVKRPEVPKTTSNPIDAFILTPAPQLDRNRLIRRVTLDLIGLPPTPEEVTAFLNDKSPNAYEKVVDRLLASPHYGERWGTKWLDTVRYADTNGFELDQDRPHAWRYRDYVIASFNADKPFDRFIKEQIAGDEMFPGNKEALIATGYLRAGSEHQVSGNIDPEESRQEVLTEIATNIGQTFLAMTVNCARCHNHKFDPITQADFYRLQAVFAGAKGEEVEIVTPEEKAEWERTQKEYKARLEPIEAALKELAKPFDEKLRAERRLKLKPELLAALDTPKDQRNEEQKKLAKDAESQIKPDWDEIVEAMPPDVFAKRAKLREQLNAVKFTAPDPLPSAYAFVNTGKPAPQSHVLRMGDPHSKLEPIEPAVPLVVRGDYQIDATKRRTTLANWLASPDNPLTARVMVNRIWQFRTGNGLIRTPNDFGVMGAKTEHRDLLDWLASEFVAKGWSIKAIDRLIVTSSTYHQSGARKRFDAEMIRDAVLSVAGTLNPQLGGRPVKIPIEQEVYDLIFTEHERDGLWPVHPDKSVQNRRGIYLYNKRSVRLPLLSAFDQPDAITSCPVRPVSTHALQALSLFNSDFMQTASQDFAQRLEKSCGKDQSCRIDTAWRLALSRPPR
ncbi:MAG TPA: DUF1549 domain-containing protein, partial [Bryobacteraceae bacterium]|nr:DUF1549 domain-containing protein [Bryobacteraceae bacterium]